MRAMSILLLLAGCVGHATCVPGASVSCSCPGGIVGAQICRSDGTFDACSCGHDTNNTPSSPLIGRWSATVTSGGAVFTDTIDLQADGAAVVSVTGQGSCTGTQTNSGAHWAATGTTLTLSSDFVCSGEITCTVNGQTSTINCQQTTNTPPSTAAYTLSNNDDTLTLTFTSGATQSFTRS